MTDTLVIRDLGLQPYLPVWQAMQQFVAQRDTTANDEIWILQHPPVFTLGQAGKIEHVLQPGDIPVVKVDRGGQVTYHGPGQLIAYLMLDIRRLKMGVRELVGKLEQTLVELLAEFSIESYARPDAPGVYVDGRKIASLGLRIRHGCTYHGLALNVDMDLQPFSRINPCGYAGLRMVQMRDLIRTVAMAEVATRLSDLLVLRLGYRQRQTLTGGIESI